MSNDIHPHTPILLAEVGTTLPLQKHQVTVLAKGWGITLIKRHFAPGEEPGTYTPAYEIISWGMTTSKGAIKTDEMALAFFEEHRKIFAEDWAKRRDAFKQNLGNRMIAAGGHLYTDAGTSRERTMLGFAGSLWILRSLTDPKSVRFTNNLWHGGKIPDEIREEVPDTHEVLTKEKYLQEFGSGRLICPKCLKELRGDADIAFGHHAQCP